MTNEDNQANKDLKKRVTEEVYSELVRQTGDLGNYVLKAFFLTIAGLSVVSSLVVAFLEQSEDQSLFDVPSYIWMILAFLILSVWLSVLHLTFVHVRSSIVLARLALENPKVYFAGQTLMFLRLPLWLSKFMIFMIKKSHRNDDEEKPTINGIRIPMASVAILEGFFLFSLLLAVPFSLICYMLFKAIRQSSCCLFIYT